MNLLISDYQCGYRWEKQPAMDSLEIVMLLPGTDVHKGFNKRTGTYNHISKNAHFSTILFCGTMYLLFVCQ